MKLLLLLAALTTTTLAKPFFSSYRSKPGPSAADKALCTLLFYPFEGWINNCSRAEALAEAGGSEGTVGTQAEAGGRLFSSWFGTTAPTAATTAAPEADAEGSGGTGGTEAEAE